MALIRLIDPDGEPVLASEAAADELRSRGYSDPGARKVKAEKRAEKHEEEE